MELIAMKNLSIEKYQENDFPLYFSLTRNDDVMKYITGKGLTEEEALKKFTYFLSLNVENEKVGYFKILENSNHIGDCKLLYNKEDPDLFELGYMLYPVFWGKGFGSIICRELLDLADEINPRNDIIGIIASDNIASKKLLEKFGFETYFLGMEDGWHTEKLILRKSLILKKFRISSTL